MPSGLVDEDASAEECAVRRRPDREADADATLHRLVERVPDGLDLRPAARAHEFPAPYPRDAAGPVGVVGIAVDEERVVRGPDVPPSTRRQGEARRVPGARGVEHLQGCALDGRADQGIDAVAHLAVRRAELDAATRGIAVDDRQAGTRDRDVAGNGIAGGVEALAEDADVLAVLAAVPDHDERARRIDTHFRPPWVAGGVRAHVKGGAQGVARWVIAPTEHPGRIALRAVPDDDRRARRVRRDAGTVAGRDGLERRRERG